MLYLEIITDDILEKLLLLLDPLTISKLRSTTPLLFSNISKIVSRNSYWCNKLALEYGIGAVQEAQGFYYILESVAGNPKSNNKWEHICESGFQARLLGSLFNTMNLHYVDKLLEEGKVSVYQIFELASGFHSGVITEQKVSIEILQSVIIYYVPAVDNLSSKEIMKIAMQLLQLPYDEGVYNSFFRRPSFSMKELNEHFLKILEKGGEIEINNRYVARFLSEDEIDSLEIFDSDTIAQALEKQKDIKLTSEFLRKCGPNLDVRELFSCLEVFEPKELEKISTKNMDKNTEQVIYALNNDHEKYDVTNYSYFLRRSPRLLLRSPGIIRKILDRGSDKIITDEIFFNLLTIYLGKAIETDDPGLLSFVIDSKYQPAGYIEKVTKIIIKIGLGWASDAIIYKLYNCEMTAGKKTVSILERIAKKCKNKYDLQRIVDALNF